MEWARVKTILIWFMLAVNAILLIVFFQRRIEASAMEKQNRQNLVDLLAQRGVSISAEVIPDEATTAQAYEVPRETEKELALVEKMIGTAQAQDAGGNIMLYAGERGSASFRGEGNFDITFSEPVTMQGRDDVQAGVREYLDQLGFAMTDEGRILSVDDVMGVRFTQSFDGKPVFNAQMFVQIDSGGSVIGISGRWVMGAPEPLGGQSMKSTAYALLAFVRNMQQAQTPCDDITDMQLGYFVSSGSRGNAGLTPVWQITANGTQYYIEAMTGKMILNN